MAAEATAGRFRAASTTSGRVALAAAVLTVAMFGVCGVLLLLTRDYQRAVFGGGGTVAALVCLAVGFVVARRQPASPIGWLLLGWSLLTPVVGIALLYSVLDYRIHRGTLPFGPVAVVLESGEFGIAVLAALTVLLFPDGRSLPLRWRWLLWVFLAASAMFTAVLVTGQALAISRHPLRIGPSGAPLAVPVASGILGPLGWTADGLILVCWAIIMGRQVGRYRRSTGNQRQQLKWVIGGAACCVVATTITIFAGNYSSSLAQAVQDAADLGAAALPAAIGVGIVKYRLYDIDRIVSRTLAYAIVTSLLVGVYAGLVLLATRVLSFHTPVAVAASTLAAAALFNPVRRRVQRLVDRRFNRARYDADQTVAAFAARLKDAVDLDSVRADLASMVTKALEPAHVSVWISHRDGGWLPS